MEIVDKMLDWIARPREHRTLDSMPYVIKNLMLASDDAAARTYREANSAEALPDDTIGSGTQISVIAEAAKRAAAASPIGRKSQPASPSPRQSSAQRPPPDPGPKRSS